MANPAELLHKQLLQWQTNATASTARLGKDDSGENRKQLAHKLRIASMHLLAIRDFLDRYEETGRDATMWRKALDRWTLGLFLFPHGWSHTQATSFDNSDLHLLQSLGDLMQMTVPELDKKAVDEIPEFLKQIRDTATEGNLDLNLKRHLFNVLSHIEWCLENYTLVGDFELEKAWMQLAATVNLAETNAPEEQKSRWASIKENWLNPFVVGSLSGLGGNLLTQSAALMITS